MKPLPQTVTAGAALACALFLLAGCTFPGPRRTQKSSSVVSFLYPRQAEPLITPMLPVLKLPLRVGLAFVPVAEQGRADFTEAQKLALLNRVAAEFRANAFIQSIEVIPSTYLRPGGGFENLDQMRSLLGLDVVALLAYDQMQFTDQTKLSLAYWTIVGAYLFHGQKNDTHTLLEAVVYDIPSRALLFRAPGVNSLGGSATAVEASQRLRRDSATSFDRAADDLVENLQSELVSFKERIKSAPAGAEVARIENRPGYTGGGATPGWLVGLLAMLALARRWWMREA